MKHIKKYINYEEISRVDFFSQIRKDTTSDIKRRLELEFPTLLIFKTEGTYRFNIKNGVLVVIFESRDEWFYVFVDYPKQDMYYKCDQFDGLIDCLKQIYNK